MLSNWKKVSAPIEVFVEYACYVANLDVQHLLDQREGSDEGQASRAR